MTWVRSIMNKKSAHVECIGRGFTLIEAVIAVALFTAISVSLFATYQRVFTVARMSQARVNAIALADEQFEVARNLPFSFVGTIGGIPSGVLKPVQTLVRGGMTFIATTTVRNVDQPFDGVAGGAPNDLSPADNRLVEIDMTCTTCINFRPFVFTTWIGPRDLEGSSTNGSLFVKVIGADGIGVSGASVNVFNASSTPLINISDVTGTSGMLQLVDAPPGNQVYQVSVGKAGYSSERTYGAPTTTNPVNQHATVAAQTVTQLTLAIDRTATLNFSSVDSTCAARPNINLHVSGTKLISTAPNVLKYDAWTKTDASGFLALNDIEWDTYTIGGTSTTYELAGVTPLQPISITPGAVQNIQLVLVPKNSPSVLVTIKDLASRLAVTGADVTLAMGGASTTLTTGRGFLQQTDWSGGGGQSAYVDPTQYAASDANIDTLTSPGEVRLLNTFGDYALSGWLESSTFDTGSASNFYQFTYQPIGQPIETGGGSVQFQIATGNSTSSWTYLGPDGTASTYYTATTTDIAAINNGNRYLRYKMFLSTASTSFTPSVSDIQFGFTSACVPPGQVIFQGLTNGTYDITVVKAGYSSLFDTVTVDATTPWQEKEEIISP